MGRFLIYFSYFGHRYSGLQRQNRIVRNKPLLTVQGALENALKRLQPSKEFKIVLSSRTDKGVHSLKNACHVDLEYPEAGKDFDPEIITSVMNYGLEKELHDVRVLKTLRVNSSFHARLSAVERKYVYRIAHTVGGVKTFDERQALLAELKKIYSAHHKYPRLPERGPLPITDAYKIRAFRSTLDISKLVSAAEVCSGIHDFTSFTRPIKPPNYQPHPVKLLTIGVKRGRPLAHQLDVIGHDAAGDLEFWDIHVRAKSFLFRQVRRLVGGMVMVAKNKISLDDLKDILAHPRVNYPFAGLLGLEETGLFLADVAYHPEDLIFKDSASETISTAVSSVPYHDCVSDSHLNNQSTKNETACDLRKNSITANTNLDHPNNTDTSENLQSSLLELDSAEQGLDSGEFAKIKR